MERTAGYERVIDDSLMPQYQPKIQALLREVGLTCAAAGMVVDRDDDGSPKVWDMCGDDFRWSLCVYPGVVEEEHSVDITVSIAEAREYGDDETHDGYGVNFALDITAWGGEIIGGLTPFNYTEECWVDARDADAVRERWEILSLADIATIPSLIEDFLAERDTGRAS